VTQNQVGIPSIKTVYPPNIPLNMISKLNKTPTNNVPKTTLRAFRRSLVKTPTRIPAPSANINAYQIKLSSCCPLNMMVCSFRLGLIPSAVLNTQYGISVLNLDFLLIGPKFFSYSTQNRFRGEGSTYSWRLWLFLLKR